MFGDNPLRKQDLGNPALEVVKVFRTIQGEGPFAGDPAIFVRLRGCNLKCYFCDTDFENDWYSAHLDEVLTEIKTLAEDSIKLVVITGGEPFRQNIAPLTKALSKDGYRVQIETAGTISNPDFPWKDNRVSVVVSPKTGKLHKDMAKAAAWKYIYAGVTDSEGFPALSTQREGKHKGIARPLNNAPIYMQPMDSYDEVLNEELIQSCAELCMQHGYRFSFQIHKAIGVE